MPLELSVKIAFLLLICRTLMVIKEREECTPGADSFSVNISVAVAPFVFDRARTNNWIEYKPWPQEGRPKTTTIHLDRFLLKPWLSVYFATKCSHSIFVWVLLLKLGSRLTVGSA